MRQYTSEINFALPVRHCLLRSAATFSLIEFSAICTSTSTCIFFSGPGRASAHTHRTLCDECVCMGRVQFIFFIFSLSLPLLFTEHALLLLRFPRCIWIWPFILHLFAVNVFHVLKLMSAAAVTALSCTIQRSAAPFHSHPDNFFSFSSFLRRRIFRFCLFPRCLSLSALPLSQPLASLLFYTHSLEPMRVCHTRVCAKG